MQSETGNYRVEFVRLTNEGSPPLVVNSWVESFNAPSDDDFLRRAQAVFRTYWRPKGSDGDVVPLSYESPIPEAARITTMNGGEICRWTIVDELRVQDELRTGAQG
jgi:hypothetical protein